ncbi:CAP domain-containing protein, partial [Bacillus sp. JJ1532]
QQQPVQKPVQQKPVQQQPAKAPTTPVSSSVSAFEQKVVELTNQERAKNGVPALQLDVNLSKVARAKSLDMKNKGYFDHNSPTYGSPFDMMKSFGITYRSAGENIAMGQRTPEEVVNAWMNSDGHRKNILNASFTHIGVGYVAEGNYWTQQFIGK